MLSTAEATRDLLLKAVWGLRWRGKSERRIRSRAGKTNCHISKCPTVSDDVCCSAGSSQWPAPLEVGERYFNSHREAEQHSDSIGSTPPRQIKNVLNILALRSRVRRSTWTVWQAIKNMFVFARHPFLIRGLSKSLRKLVTKPVPGQSFWWQLRAHRQTTALLRPCEVPSLLACCGSGTPPQQSRESSFDQLDLAGSETLGWLTFS